MGLMDQTPELLVEVERNWSPSWTVDDSACQTPEVTTWGSGGPDTVGSGTTSDGCRESGRTKSSSSRTLLRRTESRSSGGCSRSPDATRVTVQWCFYCHPDGFGAYARFTSSLHGVSTLSRRVLFFFFLLETCTQFLLNQKFFSCNLSIDVSYGGDVEEVME